MEINNDTNNNSEITQETQKPGLWSVSFFAMLLTQFLGAFNDNMFRFLMIPIGIFALQDYLCGLETLPSWAGSLELPALILKRFRNWRKRQFYSSERNCF
jgi:hypothetical protein